MTRIMVAGVAVMDFIFRLDSMPARPDKYRARDAAVSGGGNGANAAVAISRLGGNAVLATRLGDDPIADMIVAGLEADGVDCSHARRFGGRKSSFSSIFIDAAGERQIVNFRDVDMDFGASWLEAEVLPAFDAALADTRWPQGAAALMRIAESRGMPGVVDAEAPIAEAMEAMRHASHIAFSAQGLRDYSGTDDLETGLRKARHEFGCFVAVTDGLNGAFWAEGDTIEREPAFPVDAVDTLGAGDVWHGAFALALAEGRQTRNAIRFANAAAALKCTRFGGRAGAPARSEVEKLIRQSGRND